LERLAKFMADSGDRDPAAETSLDGDIGNVSFEELGFDSLALFNTCVEIENVFPVKLSLDEVLTVETPNGLLELVNQHLDRGARSA
jgi:act minimal PKS acyl carrier protein